MRSHRFCNWLFPGCVLLLSACATHPPATPSPAQPAQTTAQAQRAGFQVWVRQFRARAAAQGIGKTTLAQAFDSAQFLPAVIKHDRHQPEFRRAIWDYLDTAVSALRVRNGRAKLQANADAAQQAQARYGVPREIVAAIWGLESNYGSNTGGYTTIDALATLGYDGRRPDFARRQLMATLRILENGDVDRAHLTGSWAGALGQPQFLPTNYLAYAVDGDGDGRRDIWSSVPDVLASIADFLARSGWQTGQPWGAEVVLPQGFDYASATLETRQPSSQWAALGVRPAHGTALPALPAASIITPAGARGPAFLVGNNYRAILHYNHATSYALAVVLLGDQLAGRPGLSASWPRGEPTLSSDQVTELQRLLNAHGYDAGTPDGLLGPNTGSAVRAYQRAIGVTADGFATIELLRRLRGGD